MSFRTILLFFCLYFCAITLKKQKGMDENTAKENALSKRDTFSKRLKERYPDKEFADDEALFGQIGEDYDAYDKQIGDYKEREKSISDLFTKDPRSARFMMEWKDGGDPLVSLVRMIGTDGLQAMLEDEEKAKELSDANAEYLERVAKSKELEEQRQKNLAESLSRIEKMQAERGLTDEQMDAALETLIAIGDDSVVGIYSEDNINLALKANGYDEAVANAAYEGEVKGRNAKIDAKLRTARAGDGVASLDGKNTMGTPQRKRAMNIFDYAEAAK